jgi:hypothetical protein
MILLGSTQPNEGEKNWRRQLDRFVKANQQELAALAWGLWLENGDTKGTVGIDMKPTPHFVYCPKAAIEALNNQVENKLQEILGIVDAHKPEVEVLMIGIGDGQIKLIQFEPSPAPPVCFEQAATNVDTLLDRLEAGMSEQIER